MTEKFEWLSISEVIKNGWCVGKLISEEGWEFEGGALRRPLSGDKNDFGG
jgi:hypothetical protein